jgi:hypothetical protein
LAPGRKQITATYFLPCHNKLLRFSLSASVTKSFMTLLLNLKKYILTISKQYLNTLAYFAAASVTKSFIALVSIAKLKIFLTVQSPKQYLNTLAYFAAA